MSKTWSMSTNVKNDIARGANTPVTVACVRPAQESVCQTTLRKGCEVHDQRPTVNITQRTAFLVVLL